MPGVGPGMTNSAFRARGPLLLPLRVGPLQQVLGAGTAQMHAAVLHHHFAIDIAGLIRNQKTGEIGELAVLADAAERIFRRRTLAAAFGPELCRRACSRKWSGRD